MAPAMSVGRAASAAAPVLDAVDSPVGVAEAKALRAARSVVGVAFDQCSQQCGFLLFRMQVVRTVVPSESTTLQAPPAGQTRFQAALAFASVRLVFSLTPPKLYSAH